jgi:hypothetical protein
LKKENNIKCRKNTEQHETPQVSTKCLIQKTPKIEAQCPSAVSASSAKLAFKSNEEIAVQARTLPHDELIQNSEPVLLLKIDVQGWE